MCTTTHLKIIESCMTSETHRFVLHLRYSPAVVVTFRSIAKIFTLFYCMLFNNTKKLNIKQTKQNIFILYCCTTNL